jgi:transcriptional regulator with XRE-family HTH domain
MVFMKNETTTIDFGKRLASLRQAAGLTQQELADKIGASRRVIAYYEGESRYPPAHLLVPLAEALGISTDYLLDAAKEVGENDGNFAKLLRKLKAVSTFSNKDQKAVFHLVQTIEEKNKSQQQLSDSSKERVK